VVFETEENSQVIAKYLNERFNLGLFPPRWRGVQAIIWRYIENDIEGLTFKLNDIYWEEQTPPSDRLRVLRHKERKFGRGCFDRWREQQAELLAQLSAALAPFEHMLMNRPFLLDEQPLFIDFDLHGMMANFLYSGHYQMPADCPKLSEWYQRISKAHTSEKLRSRH
jgi:glutathione S-transferase